MGRREWEAFRDHGNAEHGYPVRLIRDGYIGYALTAEDARRLAAELLAAAEDDDTEKELEGDGC